MSKYIILTDVTCDLCEEIRKQIGMKDYITGHVHFDDGRDYATTLDWSNISRADFYKALSNKKSQISTAPANADECYEYFEKYVREGYSIISISLSSAISATYNLTRIAADRVKEQYPESRIYCLDSARMSGGMGLLVIYAHLLQKEGKSFEEVIQWLEDNKLCIHQMGPIDDLFFVARRGRLTMGKAIMGSLAGVKPMGDCNAEGYTTVLTKVKGIGKALDITVQYVKAVAVNAQDQIILIAHSDRELYANTLKERIEAEVSPKQVLVTDVFSSCGTNIGPGMVGVYFLGNKVTEDLAAEREIMNKLTGK